MTSAMQCHHTFPAKPGIRAPVLAKAASRRCAGSPSHRPTAAAQGSSGAPDQGAPLAEAGVQPVEQLPLDQSAPLAEAGVYPAAQRPPRSHLPFLSDSEAARLQGAHKPVGLVAFSACILSSALSLSAGPVPLWLPLLAGGALGSLYAGLNSAGMRKLWRSPSAPLSVVITGGSRGLGKALAREFLRAGDRVMITSRTQQGADAAAARLRAEAGAPVDAKIWGFACDVSDPGSVAALAEEATRVLGAVDCWINNAGYSGSFMNFVDQAPEVVARVAATNLTGSLLCTHAALRLLVRQPHGGHVFNMEGAGSDGSASPKYAAYGATKAALSQLHLSLQHEAAAAAAAAGTQAPVGVHTVSPGMVLTELLLEGATPENKAVFNLLCEQPETAAAFLVPRARTVVARGQSGARIRYLTTLSALGRFVTAPLRVGRFFDKHGHPVYPPEAERIGGQHAKRTQRLARRAAARTGGLQVAYGASIAVAYLLLAWPLVLDQVAKAAHGS